MKCINVAKQRCTGSSPKSEETHQQKSKEKKTKNMKKEKLEAVATMRKT